MTGGIAITLATSLAFASPPSFDSIRSQYSPSDRYLLDRNGEPIQRIRTNNKVRRSEWVKLDDVSPAMVEAVLASEDKRFFDHGGVDWRAAASAAITNLRSGEVKRGASSISMQVAASFDASLARANAGKDARTMSQKIDQAQAAWQLERAWSKEQILETYLNTIYFRGELQGIGAASEQLFGKAAHGLDRIESSILAALIRAPQAPRVSVERRACEVLRSFENKADCAPIAYAIDRWGSVRNLRDDAESIAPHVVKYLTPSPSTGAEFTAPPPSTGAEFTAPSPSRGGRGWGWGSHETRTTLDRSLQLAARDAIRKHLQVLAGRNAHDAAVVVIDHATGEVLAYVGSSGQLSEAGDVDAARAPRQAGSTLKPFIYGLGIEKNLFTAATLLDDSPFSVDVGGGAYTPQNYAHEYVGPVSVRTALASSLNVPAIRALTLVGVAPTHALLKRAGLTTLVNDPEHYGYSLALGSADVSLIELTNAYRAIANGGMVSGARFHRGSTPSPLEGEGGGEGAKLQTKLVMTQPSPSPLIPPPPGGRETKIFSEQTAWLVANMLSDRGARYVTFGFDSPLSLSHWSAVKTGTSKDMRDNWAIGFNTRVTVGVWVGNARGLPMHGVTGVSGAGPIWADVMEAAAARFGAGAPPKAPASIVRQRVEFASSDSRIEASRSEYFVRGTEPTPGASRITIAAREANSQGARIVSPTDGAIIAIDPDIPNDNQRITLASGDAKQAGCWEVNGESLGCSETPITWSHVSYAEGAKNTVQRSAEIRLLDHEGVERDRVSIMLRTSLKSPSLAARKSMKSDNGVID
ncbi:MAG: penicillin-binding protein 1C [Betaproteobacteria bacterium]|nr:MAG: penicillin-binding protein 1C [Betaproteobacteria bacterium]